MTHICKPEGWPTAVGKSWVCPVCLVPFIGTRLGDHDSDASREWIERKVMDPDSVGWVASAPTFIAARFPLPAMA